MSIIRYNLGPMDNNTYLIVDDATNEAAIVDPTFTSENIWPELEAANYSIRYILNTHAHFDHIVGNAFYAARTNAPIALHRADLPLLRNLSTQGAMFGFDVEPSPEPGLFLEDNQVLALGNTVIRVLTTPGHAPGHVAFLVGNSVISGDTLFAMSIGRTDLPGGSYQTLMESIRTRLLTLPDDTEVLPGHGEPTDIGTERRENPYLQEKEWA